MAEYQYPNTSTNRRGSALIITMLIIAAISAAAFGIARIFLADVRVATSIEDSQKAFYAAEGGIEEGLLRYRLDKFDDTLNQIDPPSSPSPDPPITRSSGDWRYAMYTYYLTDGRLSTRAQGNQSFDTVGEYNAGNTDFVDLPGGDTQPGDVPQDETVEAGAPDRDVEIAWDWVGSEPGNPECGVQITSVLAGGNFDKVLVPPSGRLGFSPFAGGRRAVRVKPLCGSLEWVAFGTDLPLGRTIQTIDVTGYVGNTKRKLTATLNRRAGSIIGFFDFVLGSEESLIRP